MERQRVEPRQPRFEAKRYCCRACLDAGVASEISRPLFETKPFPPELRRLRAHIPFY
ncbi:hypothetical protein D3C83_327860 [compost metagenome]